MTRGVLTVDLGTSAHTLISQKSPPFTRPLRQCGLSRDARMAFKTAPRPPPPIRCVAGAVHRKNAKTGRFGSSDFALLRIASPFPLLSNHGNLMR